MRLSAIARNRTSERLIALVSAIAMLMAMMAIYAAPAQAHQGTVTWGCDGWTINLSAYGAGADITVSVDGVVVAEDTDWEDYSNSGSWDDTQNHTLQVVVDAYDDDEQPIYDLGSNSSFSPDWQSGEWSFTLNITQEACNQPPQSVTTVVAAGSCEVGQSSQASGSVDITIDPDSGATVEVYSDSGLTDLVGTLDSSGSVDDLVPGTYYWTATAADGFELTGPSSGSVTIDDCDVSVSVSANVCTVDLQGQASGSADVSIDPDAQATVSIYSDAAMNDLVTTVTASDTVSGLAPGTYYWSADAGDGFDIEGPASGQFTIDPCEVTVGVGGECVLDGNQGSGEISIEISVPGGATVVVTNSGGGTVATLTESGTITVPEGDVYSWTATGTDGFAVSGPSSGEVDIEECTPPVDEVGAAIFVTVGGDCVVTDGVGEGVIDVNISVDEGATVVIRDADGVVVDTLTSDGTVTVPEGATYTWEATPNDGFEFPADFESSGSVVIDDCTPVDEVEASILVSVESFCEDGDGFIDVTIPVPDGATVVVRDSDGDVVGTLTDDGTLTVPEGATYTWEATPSEGFEFPSGFASSGSITIERCSDPETLPFTGLDLDVMATLGVVLLGSGLLVVGSQWKREES